MIVFRALTDDDFDALAGWLAAEHVQAWWRDAAAPSQVREKYGPRVRGEAPTEDFVVVDRDVDVGIVQRYRIADHPDWLESLARSGFDAVRAAGIDYLIGDDRKIGIGIGTAMIRDFTAKTFADFADVTSTAVTPQRRNIASCRALQKAGYRRHWVGTLESDDPSDSDETALYIASR